MIIRTQFPKIFAPYCVAFERSAGAIVFCVRDQVIHYLVIKYRNGHWEFPRGKMEDGESETDTAAREIREETNITDLRFIRPFRETMRFSYCAQGQERVERTKEGNCIFISKKAIFYLAKTYCGDVQISHEHQSFAWLPYDAAMQRLTYQNARNILTKADACATKSESEDSTQQ